MKNGDKVYICKNLGDTNGIPTYAKPIAYTLRMNYLTIQPTTGNRNILPYGSSVAQSWIGIANGRAFNGVITHGDLIYLDGLVPLEAETYYGEKANGYVTSVQVQNFMIKVEISKRGS